VEEKPQDRTGRIIRRRNQPTGWLPPDALDVQRAVWAKENEGWAT
jgi:hypothetical protein